MTSPSGTSLTSFRCLSAWRRSCCLLPVFRLQQLDLLRCLVNLQRVEAHWSHVGVFVSGCLVLNIKRRPGSCCSNTPKQQRR